MNENEYQDYEEEVSVPEYSEDDITNSISQALNPSEEPEAVEEEEVAEEAPAYDPALNVPPDYKVKVKVNGVEQEVTLDELRNGYQRQADYTQKTQELATQKQELSQSQNEYNQYLQSIPMLAQVAQTNIKEASDKLYSPEFTELATSDPALYIAEKAKLEKIINQNYQAVQQMQTQYNQFEQEAAQRQNAEYERQLVEANQILSKEIEGWADGSVIDSLRNFAVNTLGFQPTELNSLIDPRQVRVLHKAMLYDELMANQKVTAKKVQAVPSKTLRPGTANTTAEQDEFKAKQKRVLSSGNDRDIADLISSLI